MKHPKRPPYSESEINPQLIAMIEQDLGINQDEPQVVETPKWSPPARPVIPFHSVAQEAPVKSDPTAELYDMYQLSKQLSKTGS
jgi:hypothetical protein